MSTPPDPIASARDEFADPAVSPSDRSLPQEASGDQIGRYKLLQEIGEGGFGTVWMAEQLEPVRRKVALKIIKLGMDTRMVIARFEAERQALALMDHPHIAKVLDGGATDRGRPFFVMELVKGIPITDFCDEAKLGVPERVELFVQVCHAIQHAHHKGVIHRDIKPSNILVTLHDGKPIAKVIDFGIAKATSAELTQKTLYTEFRQMIGTPEYMAPEQAELSGLDIDTRADVYSLGVLLYELLTGEKPFDLRRMLDDGYQEMIRIIKEEEPMRPSTRASGLGGAVARRIHAAPKRLCAVLRGDLDWIVLKAMEKDRGRRYETANGMAMDLERFLVGDVVEASPPSRVYRLRKALRRHRTSFVVVAVIAVILIAGTITTTMEMLRANQATTNWQRTAHDAREAEAKAVRLAREADTARRQAQAAMATAETEEERAVEVKNLLASMLAGIRPHIARGRDTALLEWILDQTSERLFEDASIGRRAAFEAHGLLADSYSSIFEPDKAERHFRARFAIAEGLFEARSVERLRATADLGRVLAQGKTPAERERGLTMLEAVLDEAGPAGTDPPSHVLFALEGLVRGSEDRESQLRYADLLFAVTMHRRSPPSCENPGSRSWTS